MGKITTELVLQDLLDRVIEASVDRWHEAKTNMSLIEWIGIDRHEYAAWVEQKPPFKTEPITWEEQQI